MATLTPSLSLVTTDILLTPTVVAIGSSLAASPREARGALEASG